MVSQSNIKLTINFIDWKLEADEREERVQWLMNELREIDAVEAVNRVSDPNPPDGHKSLGAFLIGMLSAEVSLENFKKVLKFLGDRLGGKPIELEVEAGGKKLKVSAYSREELEFAIKAAQDFVATR